MKAIVFRASGGYVLNEDVSRPEPKEDEILVRTIAAAVNPVDAKVRRELLAKARPNSRRSPDTTSAESWKKTGAKVTKFKKGDAVYAYLNLRRGGAYAEYTITTEAEAAAKPKYFSDT